MSQGLQNEVYDLSSQAGERVAIIFNNESYTNNRIDKRFGTRKDGEDLKRWFWALGFNTEEIMDPDLNMIRGKIQQLQNRTARASILCIAIMTHGWRDSTLSAKDRLYSFTEEIQDKLTADKCSALAGRPKLFFLQACRGDLRERGVMVQDSVVWSPARVVGDGMVPTNADMAVFMCSFNGHTAFRDETNGSFFIQSLCRNIISSSKDDEFMAIVRAVSADVPTTVEFQQMPTFSRSTLRKQIFFKREINQDLMSRLVAIQILKATHSEEDIAFYNHLNVAKYIVENGISTRKAMEAKQLLQYLDAR